MNIKYSLAPLGIVSDATKLNPGQVGLANSELMSDTTYSEPLTSYAVGWRTEDGYLESLLETVAPKVMVADMFQYFVEDNPAAFAAIEDGSDVRALEGEFKLVTSHGTRVTETTLSKGLTTLIDRTMLKSDPNLINKKVAWLKRILMRAEILRAVKALNAVATNTAVTWGGASGTQPDMDLSAMVQAGGDSAGFDPNRIVMPASVWRQRALAYGSINTASAFAGYSKTPQELTDWLAIDRVYVSRERYGNGVATAKKPILGTNVALAFNAIDGASVQDPSNIKRFCSPEFGGQDWGVWVNDKSSHLIWITVSHRSIIAITSSLGIRKLTVTNGLA